MFIYMSYYSLHLLIWFIFRYDLYRWAYGVNATPENLDNEFSDYCCKAEGGRMQCLIFHEPEFEEGETVCKEMCEEEEYCDWYDTYEEI